MLQQDLAQQFEAALLQLRNEINAYTHHDRLWKTDGDIKNSGGTLCVHLIGNLSYYIGAVLGLSGYQRNREQEFAGNPVPSGSLIKQIDELLYQTKTTIASLTDDQLFGNYPLNDGKPWKTTVARLLHLLAHLNYHLGQINYHRRLLDPPVSLPADVNKL
ncbi:MAG: DUF1572 family protein [Chitinophagales bacterium]|nr:DUF1572 family protein [Chitinophagales bacterium]MDW8428192.1 DUF1572 family protein [Chitinophagales bacterium]